MVKIKFSDLSIKAIATINKMATAIMDWEDGKADGILTPGHPSYRNNNPGNIRSFSGIPTYLVGAVGLDSQNHVIFDTPAHGMDALIRQLRLAFTGQSRVYSLDMSLYQFFDQYAEENSDNYARAVASKMGVSPETTLKEIIA